MTINKYYNVGYTLFCFQYVMNDYSTTTYCYLILTVKNIFKL